MWVVLPFIWFDMVHTARSEVNQGKQSHMGSGHLGASVMLEYLHAKKQQFSPCSVSCTQCGDFASFSLIIDTVKGCIVILFQLVVLL